MIRLFVCKMVAYKEYHSIIARVIANCSEKSYPYFQSQLSLPATLISELFLTMFLLLRNT
jgi:hypothetical protein